MLPTIFVLMTLSGATPATLDPAYVATKGEGECRIMADVLNRQPAVGSETFHCVKYKLAQDN